MVHYLFGFDNPRDNPRLAEILDYFEPTTRMILSQKECDAYRGMYYQIQETDKEEMAFEQQRKLNPSSYILRIERVFRVYHQTLKKEFVYYYARRQVRGISPNETIPANEFEDQRFFGIHPKPLVKVEGFDYRGNPVNVRVSGTEWQFEWEWSAEKLDEILNDKDNKFDGTTYWVAQAPSDTSRESPSPKYRVKSITDFKQGNIFDLMEMAQSRTEFSSLEEFKETKEAQKKAQADLVVKKINNNNSNNRKAS